MFFLSVSPSQAAFSFQITQVSPSSVSDINQEIQVDLDIFDLPSDSYFRVAFQKESGASYFGQIKNNAGNWVDIKSLSSPCQDYYSIPETASTSATIMLRIGSEGREPGDYQIKAHRFTSTSCSSTEAQNTASVSLNLPSPTPTPTLTPSPTQVPVTSTPTPLSGATGTLSVPKPTSTPKPTVTQVPPTAAVLGTTDETTRAPSITPSPPVTKNQQPISNNLPASRHSYLAYLVIFLGAIMLGISGFLFIRGRKSA